MDRQIRVKIIQMCSLCFPDHWARLSSPRFLLKLSNRFRPQVVHGTAAPLSLSLASLSHARAPLTCTAAAACAAAAAPSLRARPRTCVPCAVAPRVADARHALCAPEPRRCRHGRRGREPNSPRAAPPRSPRLPAPSHGRRGHGPSSPPPPATAATRHSRRRAELAI